MFKMDERVPLHIILSCLNSPTKRLSWDNNLRAFEVIDGKYQNEYTLYYSLSLLGYKGDYIEKRILAIHSNMVIIVFFSVDHPSKPPIKGTSRGFTHLGLLTIKNVDDSTEFCFYNQTDPNSKLGKLTANIGVNKSDE